ncbi:hypothetical protein DGWBC_0383 [Dehalogenimonas sp. WBC-2]|nr:hypothetical protein DGWBC_0383 [Dehalogenimonas sp. WBC-2]
MDKETARQKIAEIVVKYQSQSASAIKSTNEAATKQGYIAPLFTALGWNFDDTAEVSPEEAASNGRVDYAFKLIGVSQFYVEAKKFSVDLNNTDFIKQAVTYAHNKGVTWAILTNFEFIRVYNANTGKLFLNLENSKYATDDFDRLWLLSKDSLQNGTLNEEAKTYGALPPSTSIEQKLFKQFRAWRESLFNQLLAHNGDLSLEQIDEVIQRLFNRLIFIRTAEDRHIENNHLKAAVHQWEGNHFKKDQLLSALKSIFRYFDGHYDSELFAPHLTDHVYIEEPTIQDIFNGLYEIPGGLASYDFSIIDADVLGAVYEQYLGYVAGIVRRRAQEAQARLALGLSSDNRYEVTAKKQRRKEQGIYYTPKYVTDFIVKETIGRFLDAHSFSENHNIKILDPACGSGSFLIRAFDELLNYHAKESNKSSEELEQYERLRILTKNIYGVDLDLQAVEIARLNMLLRSLAKQELLPGLKENIRQGNSLISGNEASLKAYFGEEWASKLPFNWQEKFNEVFKSGGFDVIIGNPPYVRVDALPTTDKTYWKDHFRSSDGKYDLYYLFIELAFNLLREGGVFAFITPNRFLTNSTGQRLREILLNGNTTLSIISLSTLQVFGDAANYPVISILRKINSTPKLSYYEAHQPSDLNNLKPQYQLDEREIKALPRSILPINVDHKSLSLALKLLKENPQLCKFLSIQEGLRIPEDKEVRNQNNSKTPIIKQFQFKRYTPISENTCVSQKYLDKLSQGSSSRITNSFKPKIIFAEDALRIEATIDVSNGLCQGGVYFGTNTDYALDLRYLLALLNSRLLTFVFKSLYSGIHMGGGYLRFRTQYLEELPIHEIDLSNPNEKRQYEQLMVLITDMLDLSKKFIPIQKVYSHQHDELLSKLNETDGAIDQIVYELYDLTLDEIKLIETGI